MRQLTQGKISICFILCFYSQFSFSQTQDASSFAGLISTDSLRSIVYNLSSDEMGGRRAGTEGSIMARDFIVREFERLKLGHLNDSYLQSFPAVTPGNYGIMYNVGDVLTINKKKYQSNKDFYLPRENNQQKTLRIADMIFISGSSLAYQKQKVDLKGKAVVILSWIISDKDSSLKEMVSAYYNAIQAGAAAVLVPFLEFFEKSKYNETPDVWELYCIIPEEQRKIPLISISWRVVEGLAGKRNFSAVIQKMKSNELAYHEFPNAKLKLTWKEVKSFRSWCNVIGLIPGRQIDNLLVVGAHFDHVGKSEGDIFHGADDNASGVAGLLEMARCFAIANKAGHKPQRTIVFVAFDGEESGLTGSEAFLRHISNIDSIYAMLNMDMIGRKEFRNQRQDRMFVLGHDVNTNKWKKILDDVKSKVPDLDLDFTFNYSHDPESLITRSDQYPFIRQGIPALFFFDNMKEDYHKPSDTAEKIDYPLLEKRVKFIFLTAWQLAFRENPKFRKY